MTRVYDLVFSSQLSPVLGLILSGAFQPYSLGSSAHEKMTYTRCEVLVFPSKGPFLLPPVHLYQKW